MSAVDTESIAALRDVQFAYPRPGAEPRSVLRGLNLALAAGDLVALLAPTAAARRRCCACSAAP